MMGKRKSLTKQVQDELRSKLRIGESKREAKKDGTAQDYIFSWSTYRTYIKHLNYFVTYCKESHGCRYLEDCKPFVTEWMQTRVDLSPYTQKLEVSAIRKLYGSDDITLPVTPPRKRENIHRSRGTASRDSHFNTESNAELITFCRCTGLRRSELEHLRGEQLTMMDGMYYLEVKGKGGRVRYAPVIGSEEEVNSIVKRCQDAELKNVHVWGKVSSAADIHSYRADYCHSIYDRYARELNRIPQKERYYCKNDRSGCVFDKRAMLEASQALGHSRINVIAGHYLR